MKFSANLQRKSIKHDGSATSRSEAEELEYVLADAAFRASARRRRFLRYIVEQTLAGNANSLTAVPIAQSVFGRDETFDHQADPVVRVEARRLRHDLERYYSDVGKTRPLRISIPKGRYAAQFISQEITPDILDRSSKPTLKHGRLSLGKLAAAATIAAFLMVAVMAWNRYGQEYRQPPQASIEAPIQELQKGPTIAVLPLLNLSDSDETQHIADGITQQLTTELARFPQLRVISLGSMQRYKDGIADPREVRRDFGATYVLDGSVRVKGDTIRIASRLIDSTTAHYVWLKNFDEKLTPTNIYEVQDAIAQEVAADLGGKYGFVANANTTTSKRKAPETLEAYDCVLRYYEYQKSINPEVYQDVKSCLETAVVLEPDYAEAWAVLSNIYMQAIRFGYGDDQLSKEATENAIRAAMRALDIEPRSATANIVLSNLKYTIGDMDGFKKRAEFALVNNPNDSDVLAHYGLRMALSGEWDRGFSLLDKAVALNPAYPRWHRFAWAFYHYDRREYEMVLKETEKINMNSFFWTYLFKAAALAQLDRLQEAHAAVEQLLVLNENFRKEGRAQIEAWHMTEPLANALVDGLEKAGLRLVDHQKH